MSAVKIKYYFFSFVNQVLLVFFCEPITSLYIIGSIGAFYFVNNAVVYKGLLVKEKGDKVVYKILIVNLCICQQPDNAGISWGAYALS